jgi:hypothetical protein
MNGYNQLATVSRTGRTTVAEASGDKRSDGQSSQDKSGANRYDTATPEGRRNALAAARRSDNPADEARVRKQINSEANSTIDALMLGLARRDNRARTKGGYRSPTLVAQVEAVAEECGVDAFIAGYTLAKSDGDHHDDHDDDHGDWDDERPEGPMREATKKNLPPWLQKDGADSGESGDSGSSDKKTSAKKRGRRGKVAESALNPQIKFRETVNWNGYEEADLDAKKRNDLPKSDFAIPSTRSYPIDTEARARSALARVDANGTPAEQKQVRAAVKQKYPDMDVSTPKSS